MSTFTVSGRRITSDDKHVILMVQNDRATETVDLLFNTAEHGSLTTLAASIHWINANGQGDWEEPTVAAVTGGFKVSWVPSAAASSVAGPFAFNVCFSDENNTIVWHTYAFETAIAKDVLFEPVGYPVGNLADALLSMNSHMANTGVHVTAQNKADWNAKLGDAPSDGNQYARKDGAWAVVQSGGGGTSDYSALTNKPQVNGVTLSGNKSLADLGIAAASAIPTKTSDLTNDSGFLTSHQSLAAYRTSADQDTIDAQMQTDIDACAHFFECTYNSTTYAEITAALAAGQTPVVKYNDTYYMLNWKNAAYYVFSAVAYNTGYYVRVNTASMWSAGTNTYLVSHQALKTINLQSIAGSGNLNIAEVVTTAPTANAPAYGVHIAVLPSAPATEYANWIYLIQEA